MDSFKQFFTSKKAIFIVPLVLIVGIALFFMFSRQNNKPATVEPPFPTTFPTGTSVNNQPFQILSTSPTNNETNVYAGEIEISYTTNTVITSANQFTMTITPPLPNYWKITNSYPTNKITALVYGGLNTNTLYTITISDNSGAKIYTWSFTTSVNPGKSSSGLISDYEKKYNQQYYPLAEYTPYYTTDFIAGYESELTLRVSIKNPDVVKVKQEVIDWIKSHGVDPATHTINYINAF